MSSCFRSAQSSRRKSPVATRKLARMSACFCTYVSDIRACRFAVSTLVPCATEDSLLKGIFRAMPLHDAEPSRCRELKSVKIVASRTTDC